MNSFLIAQALVPSESAECILWVFEQVLILFVASLTLKLNTCIFDGGRYAPRVVLTYDAKRFPSALAQLKGRGIWPLVRHLLCRWHVYEAIKRSCASIFRAAYNKRAHEKMHQFLNSFKNVVCAPNESQMKALWNSFSEGSFPPQAIEHVRKGYYESPKARKIMEC